MVTISRAPRTPDNEIEAQNEEGIARTLLGESWVWGVLGWRRRGKTTYAALRCWEAYIRGVRLLHLGNLPFGEMIDPVDLANQDPDDLGNCLLFIDEAGQILPSTRSSTIFQLLVNSNLVQSGHQGLSIIWTAQQEAGLTSRLTEQTDWVYYITGVSRRWTTDRQIDRGLPPDKDNRCVAWEPSHPLHHQHTGLVFQGRRIFNDCRETERHHTIVAECVTQRGNPLGPGQRTEYTLHCAQRFFPLLKTTHKVDAMASMMLTSDQLRDQEDIALVGDVTRILMAIGEKGYDNASPAGISDVLTTNLPGVQLSMTKLGRIMNHLGVPKKRTTKGSRYQVAAWYKDQLAAAEPDSDE